MRQQDRVDPGSSSSRHLTRLPVLVLAVALVGQAVLVLSQVRSGWFGGDAIHYLAQRGAIGTASETLWEPSAGHLQAAVMIEYRLLYEMFGMDTYLPYVLPVVIVHLAVCILVYRLGVALGAGRWASSAGAIVLLTFGAGSETYLADSMIAHSATVLLAVLAVLALVRGEFSTRAVVQAAVLLGLSFTFSVAALAAAVFVAAFTVQRKGWRAALAVVAAPVALFAAWFLLMGRDGGRVATGGGLLWDVPERALALLYTPLGSVIGTPEGGALVTVLVLLAPLLVRTAPRPLRDAAIAGTLAALTQCVMSALVSLELGRDYVFGSRYQYLVLFYLLPSLVLALGQLIESFIQRSRALHPVVAPVVALTVAALVVGNGLGDQKKIWDFTKEDQAVKARAWTTGGIAAAALGERMLDPDAGSYTVHGHDIEPFVEAGAAQWPELAATPEDRLTAESIFFTGVGPETYSLPGPPTLESGSFDKRLRAGVGCQQRTSTETRPQLTFTSFSGAQISVQSPSSKVTVVLLREGDVSDPRDYALPVGAPAFVATTAQLATVRLSFDSGGDFIICTAPAA